MDRRAFLVGAVSLAGSAIAPAFASEPEPVFYVRLVRRSFHILEQLNQLDPDLWRHECAYHSTWHFDHDTYPDRSIIRHRLTGLAYVALPDEGKRMTLQQIAPECCPCRMDLDPAEIVGQAACHVFPHALGLSQHPDHQHLGQRFFLSYDAIGDWRRAPTFAPILEAAPGITITPLDMSTHDGGDA